MVGRHTYSGQTPTPLPLTFRSFNNSPRSVPFVVAVMQLHLIQRELWFPIWSGRHYEAVQGTQAGTSNLGFKWDLVTQFKTVHEVWSWTCCTYYYENEEKQILALITFFLKFILLIYSLLQYDKEFQKWTHHISPASSQVASPTITCLGTSSVSSNSLHFLSWSRTPDTKSNDKSHGLDVVLWVFLMALKHLQSFSAKNNFHHTLLWLHGLVARMFIQSRSSNVFMFGFPASTSVSNRDVRLWNWVNVGWLSDIISIKLNCIKLQQINSY